MMVVKQNGKFSSVPADDEVGLTAPPGRKQQADWLPAQCSGNGAEWGDHYHPSSKQSAFKAKKSRVGEPECDSTRKGPSVRCMEGVDICSTSTVGEGDRESGPHGRDLVAWVNQNGACPSHSFQGLSEKLQLAVLSNYTSLVKLVVLT